MLRILGAGLITGAADDDPSGIATYSSNSYLAGRVNQYESFASYDKAEGPLGSR
jgi:hypothetical protein